MEVTQRRDQLFDNSYEGTIKYTFTQPKINGTWYNEYNTYQEAEEGIKELAAKKISGTYTILPIYNIDYDGEIE